MCHFRQENPNLNLQNTKISAHEINSEKKEIREVVKINIRVVRTMLIFKCDSRQLASVYALIILER